MTRRRSFNTLVLLAAIIGLGIGSRAVSTGWVIFDKYLGDALYAAMVYVLVSLVTTRSAKTKAIVSMAIMVAIECFQLTSIPLELYAMGGLPQVVARLLGLQFSWVDVVAYAVGIGVLASTEDARQRMLSG